jgi:hypothetical protein
MPKAAPTQVIVHRIELQQTERALLETAVAAYSVRNVTRGIFNLTSDVTTVVILVILYETLTGKTILDDAFLAALAAGDNIASALAQNWNDYRATEEYAEDYTARAGNIGLGGFRNLLDNLIGFFTGEYTQRAQEGFEEAGIEPIFP